jgi:DUF1365 family protein
VGVSAPQSCLYEGWVRHRRMADTGNAFRYPVRYACLDLDEVPALFPPGGWWRRERGAPVVFRAGDHRYQDSLRPLPDAVRPVVPAGVDPAVALKGRILHLFRTRLGRDDIARVRLLALPRMLGIGFNPVSFAYGFDARGRFAALAAEITNMPWLERQVVVLSADHRGVVQAAFPKPFHVSPFQPMDVQWSWRAEAPGDRLVIHMRNHRAGALTFDATLALARRPWSPAAGARLLWRTGSLPAVATLWIHLQAFRLWRRGATFHQHPALSPAAV